MHTALKVVAACCTLSALAAATGGGVEPLFSWKNIAAVPAHLTAAFQYDGFDVTTAAQYNGSWGLMATSRNGTINNSNLKKRAYYVEGSAYEMGFLRGYIDENSTNTMLTTYLEHIVPSLIDPELDVLLQNSTFAPTYDILLDALVLLLTNDSVTSFAASQAAGAIPQSLVDEMQGIADGARAANPSTNATFERVITLNYGYDYLLSLIYTGQILRLLGDRMLERGASKEQVALVTNFGPLAIWPPIFCDAFTARGAATKSGNGSIFARDFQFSLALVFQDLQAPTIHVPSDGRRPLVNVGGPAFVGAMTAMNDLGVAMGVDVLQAAYANYTVPGLNSLLMVRAAMHEAVSAEAAVDYVASAQRGVPWLYPLSDATGDARVIEGGPTVFNNSLLPDYRIFVDDPAMLPLLPDPAYLAAQIEPFIDYRRGIFVRNMSGRMPLVTTVIPDFNPQLFEHFAFPYPPAAAWGPGGFVWSNWTTEEASHPAMGFKYFSPEHLSRDDILLVSNLPLTPHMRIAGMNFWCSITDMGAPQWRYDKLAVLVEQAAASGGIDYSGAKQIISFLSPSATPNFNGPEVEGIMTVADLQAKRIAVKGGYWVDDFVDITLMHYLPPAALKA